MTNEKNRYSLAEMKSGETCILVEIAGGSGLRSKLLSMGITEGSEVRKISGHFLGGPIIISAGKTRLALGQGMARKIIVELTK